MRFSRKVAVIIVGGCAGTCAVGQHGALA